MVVNLILVRMGICIFNREELLAREMDNLNLKQSWRLFKGYFLNPPAAILPGVDLAQTFSADDGAQSLSRRSLTRLTRLYREDVPQLLRLNRLPLAAVFLCMLAAVFIGWVFAVRFPLPAELFALQGVEPDAFDEFEGMSFLPAFSTWGILFHNLRSLLLAMLLAVFSFGSVAIVIAMAPVAILSNTTSGRARCTPTPSTARSSRRST